ncbi:hypothetical protein PV08_05378 [Exophiala spinifera]|uniref:C3H1-type domain-containing protein n=1 Tax=Exophiala spinifera TaxID=91928 RepID=A0A0D1ZR97_9EURO|nr:uncharacterized protein PV08_05378 [Exophiala spinifera]KIW15332.1 hypothetical protein PV08_05378 [Exophiala spinifera]
MLAEIEERTRERDAAKGELDMAKDTARTYYQRMVQAESDRSHLQTSTDCDRFLLVLIDGDSMPFLDEFLSRGMEGGEAAGKHLRSSVLDYYKTNPKFHADDRVIIRVYANVRGLSRTLKAAKIISDESTFDQFIAGFNKSHPLSDYVDAGVHKEAADSKLKGLLKANFELFYRNRHCQHIFFGGSADNSYAGFLSPYTLPGGINDRVTLVEGPPFAYDLRKVAQGFDRVSLTTVFRTAKIQVVNGTQAVAGIKRPAPASYGSGRPTPSSASTPADNRSSSPPTTPNVSPIIYQNQYGQRLDIPLSYDKEYLKLLYDKNSKLCNNFYLRGNCPFGSSCAWDHSQKLSQTQLDTLRYKARTSNCRNPFCTDPTCCLGHMCPRGNACSLPNCKFLPEMHNIDVSRLYEYNTETQEKKELKPS